MAVATHLCYEGFKILISSGSKLIDAEDENLLEEILGLYNKYRIDEVIQIHSTRILRSGNYHHIDAHIVVPDFWTILEGHDHITQFEKNIFDNYSHAGELHFHLDPCEKNYCRHCSVEPCPIRKKDFESKKEFKIQELLLLTSQMST